MIGAGITLHEALKAADELKSQGTAIRVIDLYCVKPIDGKALAEQISATRRPARDRRRPLAGRRRWRSGSLGARRRRASAPSKSRLLAVNGMPHSGKPEELVDAFGISARHIVAAVREIAYCKRG